jgi:imidazole glycerol-phosphate synthase subunit HisH
MKVVLVETGMGNVHSVERAMHAAADHAGLDLDVNRTADPDVIRNACRLVVPGQGAFAEGARALDNGLRDVLTEAINKGTPYLGICIGLQLLFESSEEAPGAKGLGVFKGSCQHLDRADDIKIPHMGWNHLELCNGGHPCLDAAGGADAWMYFVHSYHAVPEDSSLVCATVEHGPNRITAAVKRDNVFATQFHAEKSQEAGLRLISAFLKE